MKKKASELLGGGKRERERFDTHVKKVSLSLSHYIFLRLAGSFFASTNSENFAK